MNEKEEIESIMGTGRKQGRKFNVSIMLISLTVL